MSQLQVTLPRFEQVFLLNTRPEACHYSKLLGSSHTGSRALNLPRTVSSQISVYHVQLHSTTRDFPVVPAVPISSTSHRYDRSQCPLIELTCSTDRIPHKADRGISPDRPYNTGVPRYYIHYHL